MILFGVPNAIEYAPRTMAAEDVLRHINLGAFTLHALSAVLLLALSSRVEPVTLYGVRTRWVSSNGTCSSSTKCVSEPWLIQMGSLNLLDICVGFGLITAGYHLLQAFFAAEIARLTVGPAYNPVRWLEYSITAPLMFVVISVLCGTQSDYLVWVSAVGMWAVMLIGGVAEGLYRASPCSAEGLALFGAASALYVGLWAPIFGALSSVNADPLRTSSMPDVVYVIVGFMCFLYTLFPVAFVACSIRRSVCGRAIDGITAEVVYNGLSLVAKIALHWQLWAAVVMQDERVDRTGGSVRSGSSSNSTSTAVYVAAGVSVVIGLIFCGVSLVYIKKMGYYGRSQ